MSLFRLIASENPSMISTLEIMEEQFTISQRFGADICPGYVFAGGSGDRSGLPWI
jgi:hypothetical protein